LIGLKPLDMMKIDGSGGPEGRMKTLLRVIRKVPVTVTVLSANHIQDSGYCWPPKSLLQAQEFDDYEPFWSWYGDML